MSSCTLTTQGTKMSQLSMKMILPSLISVLSHLIHQLLHLLQIISIKNNLLSVSQICDKITLLLPIYKSIHEVFDCRINDFVDLKLSVFPQKKVVCNLFQLNPHLLWQPIRVWKVNSIWKAFSQQPRHEILGNVISCETIESILVMPI